jgi:hypothetical protein
LQRFAHRGLRFAEHAQYFARVDNFFKFFFIMYLTATSEIATLAVTPLVVGDACSRRRTIFAQKIGKSK